MATEKAHLGLDTTHKTPHTQQHNNNSHGRARTLEQIAHDAANNVLLLAGVVDLERLGVASKTGRVGPENQEGKRVKSANRDLL